MNHILPDSNSLTKLYFFLRDIYNESLFSDGHDINTAQYSVYGVTTIGIEEPIEGFTNIEIPDANIFATPQTYPTNIIGLSAAEKTAGYNLVIFPCIAVTNEQNTTEWKTPFSNDYMNYRIQIDIIYSMEDDALDGAALLSKRFSHYIGLQNRV